MVPECHISTQVTQDEKHQLLEHELGGLVVQHGSFTQEAPGSNPEAGGSRQEGHPV